jgi:N-acetylated-alpha-linked acidic dipeptidase
MPNKLIRATSVVLFVALLSTTITSRYVFSQSGNAMRLDGYSAESSNAQRRWEEQFRNVPAPKSAREHLKRLTIEPHIAGTKEDYTTAVYVRDQLRSYGLNAELKEYQVWLNYPNTTPIVELIGKRRQRLPVTEAVVPGDPTSTNPKITPLFNGFSASGDVTGPLVYANYGLPGDYEELKKLGVDVKGKIVIVRYGNSFRGVKAKVAQDNGAIGCIIYSDPADDGYMQGDVYPKGPWRPVASGQRGSVQYLFDYPGDPLTPGKPAVAGVARLKPEEATDLTKIPVQPIAYDVAKTLIAPLEGPVRPKGFQGGLAFAYHVGGTNAVKVRLKTDMDYKIRTIWDVVARIDGNEEKDRWVVMGNHRDAWVFGAVDPNSGTSAMLEMGRGYAELLKQGWKPKRTIILCSWDAEEYGLIGSTEWAEDNAAELRDKAVAYLNVDVAVSGGNFGASSVPSLWRVLRDVTRDINDPKTGKSIYQSWQDRSREGRGDNAPSGEARIGALGSGSDYTPFLQHLGVPSTDFGFNGDYGVYHSAYDSFYWMDHFGDPGFVYHVAAAQVWGTLGMRLADADALPFDYTDYANQIRDYFNEVFKLGKQRNLDNSYDEQSAASALEDFSREAARVEHDRQAMISGRSDVAKLKKLNDGLIAVERDFIDEHGLTGRSWYKHQIYAPGIYTGYAAQPLTDFRQSIDDRNSGATRESLARIVDALKRATNTLRKARG